MQNYVLPWQQPVLLGFVLGGRPLVPSLFEQVRTTLVQASQAQPPRPGEASEASSGDRKRPITEVLLKPKAPPMRKMKIYRKQGQSQRRDKLLEGWLEILLKAPHASRTGALMVSPNEDAAEVVRLTHVDKATNTLAAWLSSIAAYVSWMPGDNWPPSERSAYEFV